MKFNFFSAGDHDSLNTDSYRQKTVLIVRELPETLPLLPALALTRESTAPIFQSYIFDLAVWTSLCSGDD